jgi:hypothetical protein
MKGFKVTDLPNRRKKKIIEQENQISAPIELEEYKEKPGTMEKLQETVQIEESKVDLPIMNDDSKESVLKVEIPAATTDDSNFNEEPKVEDHSIMNEEIKETVLEVEEPTKLEDDTNTINKNPLKKEIPLKKKFSLKCDLTVVKQMLTLDYLMTGFFLCIHSIIYTWYTGTLFDQFNSMGDTDHGKFDSH